MKKPPFVIVSTNGGFFIPQTPLSVIGACQGTDTGIIGRLPKGNSNIQSPDAKHASAFFYGLLGQYIS